MKPMRSAALLVMFAACYGPTLTRGLPCSESKDCPDGESCDLSTSLCTMTPDDGGADGRVTTNLVGRWDFDEGTGTNVRDTSGVAPLIDLRINGNLDAFAWLPESGALAISGFDVVVASDAAASKIINASRMSNELTVEVWFVPADLVQTGPVRLVACGSAPDTKNFHLAQEMTTIEGRLRTTTTSLGGDTIPLFDGGALLVTMNHAVMTRDAEGRRFLYVNGADEATDLPGGDLSNWDSTHRLVFANELDAERDFRGELHLVAIYDRALTAAEVMRNFAAGPTAP
jgi:hypothetical protein